MTSLSSGEIKRQAQAAGFDLCGISPAAAFPELEFLREWLRLGYAGEMHYLERSAERRLDVRNVLPSARSVIVCGTVYNVDRPVFERRTGARTRCDRALRVGRRLSRRHRDALAGAGRVAARARG